MPLALAAAVLLIAGAARVASQDGATDGIALLTAGMICLGAWLGVETANAFLNRRDERELRDERRRAAADYAADRAEAQRRAGPARPAGYD